MNDGPSLTGVVTMEQIQPQLSVRVPVGAFEFKFFFFCQKTVEIVKNIFIAINRIKKISDVVTVCL